MVPAKNKRRRRKIKRTPYIMFTAAFLALSVTMSVLYNNERDKTRALAAGIEEAENNANAYKSSIVRTQREFDEYRQQSESERLQFAVERDSAVSERDARLAQCERALNEAESLILAFGLGDMSDGSPVVADTRFEESLITMLENHFAARFSGDPGAYKKTLSDPDSEQGVWLQTLLNAEPMTCKLKAVVPGFDFETADDFNKRGGQFVVVLVLVRRENEETVYRNTYFVGVAKKGGKWYVYDYD